METEVPEEKLREFFNKLTASSGGKLSLEGFLKLNYQLYLNRTEKEAKKQFSRLDKDASDSLDFEEVKTLLRENWVLLPERRKELRAQLDKFSDDEYLDMELLSDILTKFGSDPIDQDNVSTFISDLDWNADGRISKDELTIFLLKGHEWDSGKRKESISGDDGENVDETSDTEAQIDRRVKEEESGEEDENPKDKRESMDEAEKKPRESPNKEKSKHGKESSHSDESSQEELSDDDDDEEEEEEEEETSQAEKTSEEYKATKKAKKEAKREAKREAREAKREAKRAKKAAKKAKKDESADDPEEEEKET